MLELGIAGAHTWLDGDPMTCCMVGRHRARMLSCALHLGLSLDTLTKEDLPIKTSHTSLTWGAPGRHQLILVFAATFTKDCFSSPVTLELWDFPYLLDPVSMRRCRPCHSLTEL